MNWYFGVLKKYAVFSGRAGRREYWTFTAISIVISVVLTVIGRIIGIAPESRMSVLATLYGLAILLPALGVSVRRLHDTGRSGLWLLIAVVPLIGAIMLLLFMVQDSQQSGNQFGPNPKGAGA